MRECDMLCLSLHSNSQMNMANKDFFGNLMKIAKLLEVEVADSMPSS